MRTIIFKKRKKKELNCVENIRTNTQKKKKKGGVCAKWTTIKVNRKWILWSNRRGTKFHLHALAVRIIETSCHHAPAREVKVRVAKVKRTFSIFRTIIKIKSNGRKQNEVGGGLERDSFSGNHVPAASSARHASPPSLRDPANTPGEGLDPRCVVAFFP